MAAAAAAVKEEDDSIECAVCLAELEEGDEARFLPRCGHGFHARSQRRRTARSSPMPPLPRPPPTPTSAAPAPCPRQIAAVVLNHPSSALTPASTRSLSASLLAVAPSLPTPVADSVLKLLWHHAPRALLFFHSLLHLPPRAHAVGPSTLDLALDLSARLRRPRQLTNSILGLFPRHRLAFTPRTFPILFERLAVSQRRPDLAVRLFLSLHRSHRVAQDLPLFNSLLDALSKSRHAGKAASLVRALEQRFTPDVVTYNTLADGWCRVKDTSRALDVLRLMVESGIAPTKTTYNIILKGFFRAGQLRHAWDFFLQMKKRGSKDESCKPDVVSYTTMVHGLGVAGQLEKARKVFDEMAKEGCAPSVATYNALIQVICKKGNVEDAVTVFDVFERAPTEIFSLSLLVQLQFGMIGSKAVYQMIYGDWKVLATVSRKSQSTATAPCLAISLKVGVFGVRVLQGHRAPVVIDLAKSILIFPGADHVDALLKKTDRASEHLYICTGRGTIKEIQQSAKFATANDQTG
ncbi:hypothetical protein OsJ_07927 [Oryza sativa Japonica Group]|uniref:RING-type domain-containing protein n=1 Tax=Oryza sativa subsp. japonica TaxID=39947 RepID=B9F1T3_ORYSJ|nr:hypothetical protein OsJ_07927 [Oryza sativa Japonica Group]